MKLVNPFDLKYWVMPEPPDNVVHLNTPHGRANARQAAILVEADRDEARRLWENYLAAIRRSVDAQTAVNDAHNEWMGYQEKSRG